MLHSSMSKVLVSLSKVLGLLIVSYFLSFGWWNLWMYSGAIGPVPFLHWFIRADGEFSYDLTQYEMFSHLVIFVKLFMFFMLNVKAKLFGGKAIT